jgi:lipopolysaccharide export system permease protein
MTSDKRYLLVTLYNGFNYSDQTNPQHSVYEKNTYPFRRDHFQTEEIRIKLIGFDLIHTDENLYRQSYKMLSLHQLNLVTDSMQKDINQKSSVLYKSMVNGQLFRYKPVNRNRLPLPDSVKNKPFRKLNFDSVYQSLSLSDKSTLINEAQSFSRDAKTSIMSHNINNDITDKRMRRYDIEWWRKFTLSAACFIFFFIGAPLGAIIRKGGLGMPVVISVLFFVMYYVISLFAEKFAREGQLSTAMGMWASSIVLLPTGIYLTRKATRESSMFSIDRYLNFFKVIFGQTKNKS